MLAVGVVDRSKIGVGEVSDSVSSYNSLVWGDDDNIEDAVSTTDGGIIQGLDGEVLGITHG